MTESLIRLATEKEFAIIFARMATQLRWLDADAAAIQSYYTALKDLPDAIIHASAAQIANEPGRKFFPTTGEWREIALALQQEDLRSALSGPRRNWTVECAQCDDTGWIYHACDAHDCGRGNAHIVPHDYVTPCFCRATNHTYQRHHVQTVKR